MTVFRLILEFDVQTPLYQPKVMESLARSMLPLEMSISAVAVAITDGTRTMITKNREGIVGLFAARPFNGFAADVTAE